MSNESPRFSRQWWVQEFVEDTKTNLLAVTAGLGSGKTHGGCDWHHDRTIVNGESGLSVVMFPSYQKIHDAAIPTYKRVLYEQGLRENLHYKVYKSPYPRLVYPSSGHEVHFVSGERPDMLIASEYSHAFVDESGSTKEDAARLLITRVRCPRAKARQILFGGAPQGITWFADWFDSDTNSGWDRDEERDHRLTKRNATTGEETRYRRVRLTSYDNPFLPDGYIQSLYNTYAHNQNYLQSYIYGLFCPLQEGNCYAEYNPERHDVSEDIKADPHTTLYLSWDFNANPVAWVAGQYFQRLKHGGGRSKHFLVCDEANQGSNQLLDACIEFAVKFPTSEFKYTPIKVFGDSSGHARSHKIPRTDYEEVYRILKDVGYSNVQVEALRYNPPQTTTVDVVNQWFFKDHLFISRRCESLKRSLLSTRWKDGQKKIEKKAGETHTHHGDALKYKIYALQEESGNVMSSFNM